MIMRKKINKYVVVDANVEKHDDDTYTVDMWSAYVNTDSLHLIHGDEINFINYAFEKVSTKLSFKCHPDVTKFFLEKYFPEISNEGNTKIIKITGELEGNYATITEYSKFDKHISIKRGRHEKDVDVEYELKDKVYDWVTADDVEIISGRASEARYIVAN